MLEVTTVLQYIMSQLIDAVSEEDKIMVITKVVLHVMKQKAARVRRPLKCKWHLQAALRSQ
jgi:hypothetical protein